MQTSKHTIKHKQFPLLVKRIILSMTFFIFFLTHSWAGNTYTVTNLNDTGQGSLRGCLVISNFVAGIDTIKFAVSGNITLYSDILITEGVFIDGTSAPFYSSSPRVTLNSYRGSILKAQNLSDLTIQGLRIQNNYPNQPTNGIELNNCSTVLIQKNIIRNTKNGIIGNNIIDIQIKDNDLRNTGLEFYDLSAAISLTKVNKNRLQGGVYISGNTFGMLGNPSVKPVRLLYLEDAKDISLQTNAGNINITNGMNVEKPICLKNIENITARYLNLSASDIPRSADDSRSCGIYIEDSKNITLQYMTIRKRHNGIIARNCTDIRIQSIDLRDTGFDFGHLAVGGSAITLDNVESQNLLGGIFITNNQYGDLMHDVKNIFRIKGAKDININDRYRFNQTNILLNKGGLGVENPFILEDIDNLSIQNIDVTSDYTGDFEGIAFDIKKCRKVDIFNTIARKRLTAVEGIDVTDISIEGNDFRDTGIGFFRGGYAIKLDGLFSNSLLGGIFMYDNQFGSYQLTPLSILSIKNAQDIFISDRKIDNPNIYLNNSGLDVEYPLFFDKIENLSIKRIDLTSAKNNGVAIEIRNSQNVNIESITARKRGIAINGDYLSNTTIVGNDFIDSGFMSRDEGVSSAITLFSVEEELFIYENRFGKDVLNPQSILSINIANEIHISGSRSQNKGNIILNDTGLNLDYPIRLQSIERLHIQGLNLMANNSVDSKGMQIRSSQGIYINENHINGWENGIELTQNKGIEIECNNFVGNQTAIKLIDTEAHITKNNFKNLNYAIDAVAGAAYAEENYWGAADGSRNNGGSGDIYVGNVDEGRFYLKERSKCAGEPVFKSKKANTLSNDNKVSEIDKEKNFTLSIYPNPTYNVLNIKLESSKNNLPISVKVFDVLGKEIYSLENIEKSECKIDLSNQNAGVYFIQIATKERIFSQKVIKQ